MPALSTGAHPQQSGDCPRERVDRVSPRPSQESLDSNSSTCGGALILPMSGITRPVSLECLSKLNDPCADKYAQERLYLQALPRYRVPDYEVLSVRGEFSQHQSRCAESYTRCRLDWWGVSWKSSSTTIDCGGTWARTVWRNCLASAATGGLRRGRLHQLSPCD